MLGSLIVRIGADTTDLNRDLAQADRTVTKFGKKLTSTGRDLSRIGNSASIAAGSMSRLSSVLPGVAGGMGRVVGSIGTAGVVLGEATVLTAGLTKGMRLLQAASTAVAASSAPAWLASLATPAGLAVAGVAALTASVWGLSKAWDSMKKKPIRDLLIEEVDLTGRKMPLQSMTGRRAHMLETVTAGTGQQLGDGTIQINLARQAVEAWGQALDGVRPITYALAKQWDLANESIRAALRDTSKFTDEAIGKLFEMKAALKQVSSAAAPGEAGAINMGGLPRKGLGQGLDPRAFLGSQMDFRPTPTAKPSLLDQTKSAASGFGGDAISQLVSALNPLAVVMPVISGIFEALAPILEPLVPIFESLGQIIGTLLAPVIKVVAAALSYLAEGLGWVIRGIGRLVDALPGISAKGVINAGQAMIDAAKAARRNADATNNATDKVNEFAGALSNIPRVLNLNSLRHLVGANSRPRSGSGGTGSGTGGAGKGGPSGPLMSVSGGVNFYIYGATDPEATAEAVGRVIERRASRGGTTRLQAALV